MFSGKGSISSRERSFFRRLVNRNVAGFFRPFHRSSGTYLGKQQKDVKYTYICVCVCVGVCTYEPMCIILTESNVLSSFCVSHHYYFSQYRSVCRVQASVT